MKIQESSLQLTSTHEASRRQSLEIETTQSFRTFAANLGAAADSSTAARAEALAAREQRLLQSLIEAILAALDGKKSEADTTMGMTALDGLPMGTRCGALDAGVVIYMLRDLELNVDEAERNLYEESGLKGLSGLTNDVKALSESSDPRAMFALVYFSLKTAQHIAAMAVSIGGLDVLVFTGGIGENAPDIRGQIASHLSFLPGFDTLVIAANEERSMALEIFERFRKDF